MTGERWQQVKTVLEASLQMDSEKRRAYLDQACSSDQSLRYEVESLLAADKQAQTNFLECPPLATRLEKGTRLGDYEIQSLLGAGGMGEVYRARDLRLRRDVAVKVLPAVVSSDPERLRRFEQEATAAAALNHPNILAVHQLGTYGGAPYLVSELLEGETLREQIRRGRIALRRVIDYAVQIAHGLSAAHEKGIVHRDLKPENLFLTKDGRVKILDFGLAKLTQAQPSSEPAAPTIGSETETGLVMGTVGYMSPEQVRGQAADSRADIFAFGAILYEMLTGKRAFQEPTSAETMSAILNEDPSGISQLLPNLPPALQRVVHRCLEKNPEQRFQSASDLAFALEGLSDSGSSSGIGVAQTSSRSVYWWATTTAILVISALAAILYWLSRPPRPPKVLRYAQLTNDGRPKYTITPYSSNAIVTDGARLYFRELIGGNFALAQVSASGGETALVSTPFEDVDLWDIAPDHSQLLISGWRGWPSELPLWTLPLPAGTVRRLGDVIGHEAAWSPDGQRIVYAHGTDLYTAKNDGTDVRKVASGSGISSWPRWSPDGKVLRFTVQDPRTNSSSIWEVAADGSKLHRLFESWNNPPAECCGNWTPNGRYFVFQSTRDGKTDVWAFREAGSVFRKRVPDPVVLTAGPISYFSPVPALDGRRLFVIGNQPRGELVRYDKKSRQFVPYLSSISAHGVSFSGDGRWVAYVSYPEGALWRSRIDGTDRLQLTFSPMLAAVPYWSPEGNRIAFMGRAPGKSWQVYLVPADGGTPRTVSPEDRNHGDPSWSPDGLSLAFGAEPFLEADNAGGVFILDLRSNRVSRVPGSERMYSPHYSPDGRYIAVQTSDSLKQLLFDLKTQDWGELTSGSTIGWPNWSRDGNYIYYDALVGNEAGFYRVRISDRKIEPLVSFKDLRRATVGIFGPWAGLAPDDSPLVLRDSGTQEIYSLDVDFP